MNLKNITLTIGLGLLSHVILAQDLNAFSNPPNDAKPRVWWHWMNGNITKDGIQKDLDWMEKTGIGGIQNFDAALLTPVVIPKKVVFMTPEWKDAFKFTTELAHKKGLEMAIAGSPGWSVTGGPWVEPKDGMKKYVWSEVLLQGGQLFKGIVPRPSNVTGPFLDVAEKGNAFGGNDEQQHQGYYHDSYVIAYKLPITEKHLPNLHPKITVSGGKFDVNKLLDHDIKQQFEIPAKEVGEDMYIQYAFEEPQTFKAFGLAGGSEDALSQFNGIPLNRYLRVSDDGVNFRTIAHMSGSYVPFNTQAIPATTAKYWRMCFVTLKPEVSGIMAMMEMKPGKPKGVKVSEFVLFNTNRIDQWEDKAGFFPWREEGIKMGTTSDDVVKQEDIIDLSSKMKADGSLEWEVPAGEWMILRMGYSLTGHKNSPASPEATGLEVDKLDKEAVRRYINTYLDMYEDATGGLMGEKGLTHMVLDSYEAGIMNWTHDFPEQFEKRRGYALLKWLPALTGRVVESLEESEKFLWDFRKTIGEMIVENHYELIGEELQKRGMKRYTESHEDRRIFFADGMDVKRRADIPMSAMWTPGSLAGGNDEEVRSEADIREAASIANIYGKPYVAAESMTSVGKAFTEHPEVLKRTADLELASGLNRFVIHTSVHQPFDKGPGFSLGPFGQYFTRLETWSGAGAKAWVDYLSRSSYLMQQGKNVADILYYYGENTNITWICRESLPKIPKGLEFDFVNATILKEDIQVKNGLLVAPSGSQYKVLMLDESAKEMTLGVLQKIKALQDAGVKVVGQKPLVNPSLSDDALLYSKLAAEVGAHMTTIESLNLTPDVIITGTAHKVLYRHRRLENGNELYWINNRNVEPTAAVVSFNVTGKVPILWNAETGEQQKLSFEMANGRTEVPLSLKSWDAVFMIFADQTEDVKNAVVSMQKVAEQKLTNSWQVDFNGMTKELKDLTSWTDADDTKYFSGTATYSTAFNQKKIAKNATYILEIEDLKNIAEVILNGKTIGTIWKQPYQIDFTSGLIKGANTLDIKVTNTWVNKLIGDAQPAVKDKTTFTSMPLVGPDMPLLPAGIIGDVKVILMK